MGSKRRASIAAVAVAAAMWVVPAAFAGDTQVQVFDPEGKVEKYVDNGKAATRSSSPQAGLRSRSPGARGSSSSLEGP